MRYDIGRLKLKTMYGNASKIAVNATCGKYFNKIGLPHVYIALFRCLWVPGGGLEPFRRVLRSGGWRSLYYFPQVAFTAILEAFPYIVFSFKRPKS